MKHTRKKKVDPEELVDDGRPVRFEALGELTSSEVIDQVKAGMCRIAPIEELEGLEGVDESQEDAA